MTLSVWTSYNPEVKDNVFPMLSGTSTIKSTSTGTLLTFFIAVLLFFSGISAAARVQTAGRPARTAELDSKATRLLDHALRLADLYNWTGAASHFADAEKLFIATRDQRNALYAQLGLLRSSADRENLPEMSAGLQHKLDSNPLLHSDKRLRMFCLIVKGDIDGEFDYSAMTEDWQDVSELAQEIGDRKWQYRATAQLGLAAFYKGDLITARRNVGSALALAKANDDRGAEIRYMTVLGIGLLYAKMYAQALPFFDHALLIARATPESGYPFLTKESRLQALIGLHQFAAAKSLERELMSEARKERNLEQQGDALILSASIDESRNEMSSALADLKEALAISRSAGYVRQVAEEESQIAELYRNLGRLEEAEQFAARAASSTQASGNLWAVPERLQTVAEVKVARHEYVAADHIYARAEAFIDSSIGNVPGVLDKTAFIRAASTLYTEHFCLVAKHFHDPSKAFSIIEQVRGRVATDSLIAGSRTPAKARADEKALSALRLKLMTARSNPEVTAIRNQIFMTEQARWVTPDLSILRNPSRDEFGIRRVQRSIGDSTLVLEYVTAEPQSYCLAISRTQFRIVPLPGEHQLSNMVAAYRTAVSTQKTAQVEGKRLYDALLRPISAVESTPALLIIRDGPLYLLPFGGLVDPTGSYVVAHHTVVYAPSATAYCLLLGRKQNPKSFARQLLAVGGVPYNEREVSRIAAVRGFGNQGLSLLPGSKQEVLVAASALKGARDTVLIGRAATKYALEHQQLSQYRIIHMAVHGFADRSDPHRSALILLSDPSAGEDGFLEASQIVQFPITANLVVLSACDTAVGPIEGEEGIDTIARAFLLAGAKSVISTLWSIDDTYSYMLMKRFYQHLAKGEHPATALAGAKRDMLQDLGPRALPYYWAGFIFDGPAN